MENVQVYGPQFQVTLFKTVKRTMIDDSEQASVRFGATTPVIDLTPFLTDFSTITTSKSVREPAGGWSITVADQPYTIETGADSLYGVVEPMDMVEIRFRHIGNGQPDLPVVMRGFVSNVARSESIGQDGTPQRGVTITGQDYGKIWQMLQIFYGPGYVIGKDIISAFSMFERFGAGFKIGETGAEFLKECFDKILNPYLTQIVSGNSPMPATMELVAQQKHGTTSLSGTQNQEGSLFGLFTQFLDVGAWNELFIAEDDSKVYAIYRPNPSLDLKGSPIDPDSSAPVLFDIKSVDVTKLVYHNVDAVDVVSMNVVRSDANTANYYWVRAPRYELASDIYLRQASISSGDKATVDLTGYINSKAALYGIRKMEVGTEMGADDVSNTSTGLPADQKTARDTSTMNWLTNRRKSLVEQNKNNVLLESGSITIRGNENIRAGNFVKINRGTFSAMYYVVQVDHQYSPFNRFLTVLTVDRGMGFVERMRKNGGPESPYYSEMAT